jgi:PAS domain S-box-containing protein
MSHVDANAEIAELRRKVEALEESEKRYRRLLTYARDFIFICDLKGRLLKANRSAQRALGRSDRDIGELSIRDIVHPDDFDRVWDALQTQEDSPLEARILTPAGEVWVEVSSWGTSLDGKPCIQGIARDITKRKRFERDLHYWRHFLKTILDLSPTLVFAKDREFKFTFVNEKLATLYGKSAEELRGQTDDDNSPSPEEVRAFRAADRKVLETKQLKYIPKESVTGRDGVRRWFETTKIYFQDLDGAPRVLGVSIDITERDKAERALLQETQLLRTLMSSSLDAIYFKDVGGRFERVNQALADFVGANSPEEMVGKSDFDYFPREYAEARREEEREIVDTRQPKVGLIAPTQPLGKDARFRETTKVPVVDAESNTVTWLIGISRDVTDRVYEDLVRFISHSLKSRVVVLETNLAILAQKLGNVEELQRMNMAFEILKRAVSKARNFSCFRSSGHAETLCVNDLVCRVVNCISDSRIRMELAVANPLVMGSRVDLEGALLELLQNSQDFAPPVDRGGEINVKTEMENGLCLIHVIDNGSGLPATGCRSTEFPTPRDPSRSGVGLLLAHYAVEKLSGRIVECGPSGAGAHFVIRLPVLEAPLPCQLKAVLS